VERAIGRPLPGSDPGLSGVIQALGALVPLAEGSLAAANPAGGFLLIQTLTTPAGELVLATAGNVFQAEDLPSFVWIFLPVILPMFAPAILGALVAVPLVVRRSLASLDSVTTEASLIDIQSVGQRLPETGLPTELQPLVTAINGALIRLDEGIRRQRLYSANAAHEMRTPIAILQSRIETLPHTDIRTALLRDVHRLHGLVEQLLTVARLDQLKQDAPQEIDLVALVAHVLADRAPLAIRSGRNVSYHPDEPAIRFVAYGRAVASAVANLVDNALVVEPDGHSVEVGIRLDLIKQKAIVIVVDHGPGIPTSGRDLVFEPFWRGNEAKPGTGLGLAIVRQVAALHGGRALVGETYGGGSTFQLELSLQMGRATGNAMSPV
jgi:two-component system OmpR family sensor kinase